MLPSGKAVCDVGLEFQHHAAAGRGGGADHSNAGQIAAAQECDGQKGNEENQRRAEIAHQCQTADTKQGKENGENQIPAGEQAIHGFCTGQNKGHFHEFRRLER